MVCDNKKYNLDNLTSSYFFPIITEKIFNCEMKEAKKIGEGFYAHVYKVCFQENPYEAIVKFHHYPGRGEKEKIQLEMLKKHSPAKIPAIYGFIKESEEFPYEALVMEAIPGVNAGDINFPNTNIQNIFLNDVIENLHVIHSVKSSNGFGEFDSPGKKCWLDFYGAKADRWQQNIYLPEKKKSVSDYVLRVIDKTSDAKERILKNSTTTASLVHSDYNLWNIMIDPKTFKLTGVIDPIDAGWSDPEIDLFHLPNCRPELGLLDLYLKEQEIDDEFWMRFYFYRFWDDIKHFIRMGWYEETRFRSYAQALEQEVDKFI